MAVSAMHAVKVADAHQRRAEVGRNFFEFVKDLHQKASNRKGRKGRQETREIHEIPLRTPRHFFAFFAVKNNPSR